ncbi:MAG: tetratricopeptide repeat protein [Tepidisphaeraceae bacterium]
MRSAIASLLVASSSLASPLDRTFPRDVVQSFAPEKGEKLEHPSYFNAWEKARAELNHGRYRTALYASYALPASTPAIEVSLLRGEALAVLGEVNPALSLLDPYKGDSRVDLLRGRILNDAGRSREAVGVLREAIANDPANFPARRELGRALEAVGDIPGAIDAYAFFAMRPNDYVAKFNRDRQSIEDARELVAAAASIDRWATLTGAYRKRPDLHNTLLAMFVAAYDVIDRTYWPAHVEAARFLANHSKLDQAGEELSEALSVNPNDPAALELLADITLENRGYAKMAGIALELRETNPQSLAADRVEASSLLLQRQSDRALEFAKRAADRAPTDIATLARLAAVQAMRGEVKQVEATLATINKLNPNDAFAPYEIGRMCGLFFDAGGAVTNLRTAVDRAPWWVQPKHELGDQLLNEGLEDEAHVVLNDAYEVDPFNLKTVNFLRVLDEISKFKTTESEHFVLRYDDRDDPIVPLYIGPYMDSVYDDLTKHFGYAFDRKPIVEVFPDAQSFSVRTAGVPGLETYGASQGRVMTVVAPRAGETLGPFNWARVMRHEFTHSINILQTQGRVPRWLTEGLAVWQEHVPFRFAWVPAEMYKRTTTGKLMSPTTMAQALLRPKGNDGEVAYMTGFWLVDFIETTYGHDAILKLLEGYRSGLSEDEVFRNALGVGLIEFQPKFDAWAREKVKGWGYDEATAKQADALAEEAKKLTEAGEFDLAAAQWVLVSKLQPMNSLPHRRLAGIFLRLNRPMDAVPHLEAVLPIELQDDRLARQLATIYRDAGKPAEALKYARMAVQIDPYDPIAHDTLAEQLDAAGEKARAEQERQVAALLRERAARAASKPSG